MVDFLPSKQSMWVQIPLSAMDSVFLKTIFGN